MRPLLERLRRAMTDKRVRIPVIAALAVGAYLLVKALLPEIDLQQLLDDVARRLGDWTYLAVGVLAFLETGAFVGLVAPGETFVVLAGAVAGVGEISVILTIAIVWSSAWAGDTVSFLVGRRLGRGFVLRHGPRVRITEDRLEQVERYFESHGGKTILIGRFIGLVRALAPFVAGTSRMRYRAFVPFSILGTGLWATTFTLVGYFAARSLDQAAHLAGRGTLLFALTVAAIVGFVAAARHLREPENRRRLVAGMERRRALRPLVALGRRVEPEARFLWQRLTPGGLGLELTALVAALAVGSFACAAYAIEIAGNPGPTPGDLGALDLVRDLQAGWLTDVELALTELGSSYVVFPLALLGVAMLLARRRFAEAAVVVAALALTVGGVDLLKDSLGRPRPADGLTATTSSGYPSGHAAYSIFYVWLALSVARRLEPARFGPRLTLRTFVLAAGICLAALVGLSRVYLHVHYLSDVVGGWGLGVSAFALCGIVAIVATHLRRRPPVRQNGAEGEVTRAREDRS